MKRQRHQRRTLNAHSGHLVPDRDNSGMFNPQCISNVSETKTNAHRLEHKKKQARSSRETSPLRTTLYCLSYTLALPCMPALKKVRVPQSRDPNLFTFPSASAGLSNNYDISSHVFSPFSTPIPTAIDRCLWGHALTPEPSTHASVVCIHVSTLNVRIPGSFLFLFFCLSLLAFVLLQLPTHD